MSKRPNKKLPASVVAVASPTPHDIVVGDSAVEQEGQLVADAPGQDDEHPSDADEQAVVDQLDSAPTPTGELPQALADDPSPALPATASDASTTSASGTESDSAAAEASVPSPGSDCPFDAVAVAASASAQQTPTPLDPRKNTVGSRTSRYRLDQCIVVLVANPKRVGTAGRVRFDCYNDGMTVQAYLEHPAVGGYGRQDIAWDLARGYICIEEPADVATVVAQRDARAAVRK